ncbi:Ig-like domain-containing protein [Nocardioides sp. 616]|uniref:Ig-like domain-containing protein n=1 Tax=Nocardioides sp. 616 TaxID=2268090 RepID=UPI000CE4317F|nr:Ig-like domain-containing protein [Nocardioides sp. 616]
MTSFRSLNALSVVALGAVLALSFPGFSSAAFSARTTATATVTAAADWTPPTVSMVEPGVFVRGTRPVVATATDRETGIAGVTVQQLSPGGTWTTLCMPTSAPYSCSWNTRERADGQYSLRAVALDKAGYQATSAPVRTTVDNLAPTVTMVDPGATLTGVRTFSAGNVADATSGVARVVLQHAPTGTTAYQDLCTMAAAPWSCSTPTAALTDGRYDFRAVATDRAGNETVSPVVANRLVDNGPALAGSDVQAQNGGATAGRIEAGDWLTYTFNRQVNLSSIVAGWDGSPRSVQVKFSSGFITNDSLEVTGSNLGSVNLRWNYVNSGFSVASTMRASTETGPDGRPRTVVTIVLDESPSSVQTRVVSNEGTTVWSPSRAVTDLLGRPSATTSAEESGPADKEF